MRFPRDPRVRTLALVVALLAIVAGCSALPTAPDRVATTGVRAATSSLLSLPDGDPSSAPAAAPTATAVSTSARFTRLLGGSLRLGRFTLVVPPLALRQDATITMKEPDPNGPECDLEISPPSANGFLVPVLLTGSYAGVPSITDPLQLSMAWYDPAQALWVAVPGVTVDVLQKVVIAPLPHFSQYKLIYTGRAGW